MEWWFLPFWIACGIAAAGFLNADWRASFPRESEQESRKNCRRFLAAGLVFGPALLVLSLIVTGFGADGWTLSGKRKLL